MCKSGGKSLKRTFQKHSVRQRFPACSAGSRRTGRFQGAFLSGSQRRGSSALCPNPASVHDKQDHKCNFTSLLRVLLTSPQGSKTWDFTSAAPRKEQNRARALCSFSITVITCEIQRGSHQIPSFVAPSIQKPQSPHQVRCFQTHPQALPDLTCNFPHRRHLKQPTQSIILEMFLKWSRNSSYRR